MRLKKQKKKSAPGTDGINYTLQKAVKNNGIKFFTKLYNYILQTGEFPTEWNKIIINFIDKLPKKGFRPIALENTIMKIFERIINERIVHFVEKENILPNNSFGFRRNRSCNDNLAILHTDILISKLKKKSLGILSLDLKGAYDQVNIEKLMEILEEINIPSKIRRFIYNINTNKKLIGYYNGRKMREGYSNKGLLQGSIISPVLLNIYTRKLPLYVPHQVKALIFADDTIYYVSHKNAEEITSILQECYISVRDYFAQLAMPISIEKSSFMIVNFPHNPVEPGQFSICTETTPLKNSYQIKYLGTIIDSNLSWQEHIEKIVKTCRIGLNMLSSISNTKWGVHPKTALLFYKSIIRPKIEWSFFMYHNAESRLLRKLDVIQNSAIRTCLGVIRTTPINVLHSIAGLPTLEIRRKFIAKKMIAKASAYRNNMLIPKFTLIKDKFLKNWSDKNILKKTNLLFYQWLKNLNVLSGVSKQGILTTFQIPFQAHFMENFINRDFGKSFDKKGDKIENQKKFIEESKKQFPGYNYICTDGSKKEDGQCGYGVWSESDQKEISGIVYYIIAGENDLLQARRLVVENGGRGERRMR